ncbi:MAG TPA: small-conductance mechanosensitive channel [Cyanobacteria bacterium UBA11149]|nr:small-conductance mechanosensitive channel [Cyanobacteria bacterium UBA11367]HBE58567.1 small-conductance mechanosensitive channel [Cyanobacteria bacterium UBA11366]HBK65248.1 small-conductance mechanosensitive channel [Cyanobacteria bacterium UBA11166]HBR76497.1 small-conductance mechanosensitive channel [Cyanobacteria bacterium UBA11159]HBS67867.1 small-conductance mechanosensitive channel [Cyanobacteria bacterium UBA11153]HBW90094.1 small-conductance mechanosensitive channel [Cyanobacter
MNSQTQLLMWAIILAVCFPLLEIILIETIHNLKRRGNSVTWTLRFIQNLVLPALAILLFMKYVWQLENENNFLKVVATLFWICAIYATLSTVNAIVFADRGEKSLGAKVPKLFRDLSQAVLISAGSALVLSVVWKIDLAGLAAALGVGSIVLGLALQDTLGSIFAGIALLFERPFKEGDWLHLGEVSGKVIDINWRGIRLLTEEQYQIVIPHTIVSQEMVFNYSQPFRRHEDEIELRFSYEHPPNFVKQVLKATALSTPGVLPDPEPVVETTKYEEFGILYKLVIQIGEFGDRDEIRDELKTRIWYAAKRYNLKIPVPVREIYQSEKPSTQEQATTKFNEGIQSVPALVRMEGDSLADLAKGSMLHNFAAGEKIIREGDRINALHIIVAGKASVTVINNQGKAEEVYVLSKGEFFGEMALFTGELAKITVTALEDMEVILIYSSVAYAMIERQPTLAREIGQIMELRRKAIEQAKLGTKNNATLA